MFSRSISDGRAARAGLIQPGNAGQEDRDEIVARRRRRLHAEERLQQLAARSGFGHEARAPRRRRSARAPLNVSFTPSGMTTSLTSGMPRRDTCTKSAARYRLPGRRASSSRDGSRWTTRR